MAFLGWLAEPAVFPWAALALGLCVGSFLNVVIHRLPRMMERDWLSQIPELLEEAESLKGKADTSRVANLVRGLTKEFMEKKEGLVFPRSRCPSCGHGIAALQNIPVVSFLILRGRCAHCRAAIGIRYPIIELISGIGAFYCAYRFGLTPAAIGAVVFLWSVIALALIDQKTGYLPDDITLPLLWFGLLMNLFGAFTPLNEAIIGAVVGYMVLWAINALFRTLRGMDGMGHGDFKMTAAVGAFLGWRELFMVILLSSLVGLIFGTLQMFAARRGWDWKFKFHFGPYIAIAGIVAMFWGAEIGKRLPMLKPFG